MTTHTHLSMLVTKPDALVQAAEIAVFRHDKDDEVIGIKRCPMSDGMARQRAQRNTMVSFMDECIQSFHDDDDDEQHWRVRLPCLSPRACVILSPGLPLRSTLVLAVDSKMDIQLLQRLRNPMCSKTSSRNGQATESNAFAISTLRSTAAWFLQCNHRQASCTDLKLSWIARSCELWFGAKMSFNLSAKRFARHLAKSLLTLCIRLIGL